MNPDTPRDSIFPSIAFWLCLFLSAGLFAVVVLVPKLLVTERLAARHRQLEQRLDGVERRNAHLDQVIEAFHNDPEFVAEVARFDLGATGPGEQRISSEAPFAFRMPPAAPFATRPRPRWIVVLEPFVVDQWVRDTALFTAAGLLIAGFAFFPVHHEGDA